MQILYVLTMVAIFILCAALLFTTRRILRASPLQSGELALGNIQPARLFNESEFLEAEAAPEMELHNLEIVSAVAHTSPAPMALAEPIAVPVPAAPVVMERPPVREFPAPPTIDRAVRKRKTKTPIYAPLLEGLLIGVSFVVLVRTQRSNFNWRSRRTSRRRVA